ncbi:hypothetical protein GOD45_23730 [Sinorhizobium medicae]|nr:hypothetical protein [Sinorhizobium medicae]
MVGRIPSNVMVSNFKAFWEFTLGTIKWLWWVILLVLFDLMGLAELAAQQLGVSFPLSELAVPTPLWMALLPGAVWISTFFVYRDLLVRTGSYRYSSTPRLRFADPGNFIFQTEYRTDSATFTNNSFRIGVQHLAPGIRDVQVYIDEINGKTLKHPPQLTKRSSVGPRGVNDTESFILASCYVKRPLDTAGFGTVTYRSDLDDLERMVEQGLILETLPDPDGVPRRQHPPNCALRLKLRIESENAPMVSGEIEIRALPTPSLRTI